jgi:hypothetical protein
MSRTPQDVLSDETWFAGLAGRIRTAMANPDAQLAESAGWLIRARFNTALQEVQATPDPELTRERILARARASQRSRSRLLSAVAAASSAGLAAGVVGTLLLRPPQGSGVEFADVVGSQEIVASQLSKSLDVGAREFVVRSRNVPATAAHLAELLTQAGAELSVRTLPGGAVVFEIAPLPSVSPQITQAAHALKIDFPSGTPLRLTIEGM